MLECWPLQHWIVCHTAWYTYYWILFLWMYWYLNNIILLSEGVTLLAKFIALGYSCDRSGIRCLKTLRALIIRVGNKWSWFRPRGFIWYSSLLNVNIVPKYSGSDLSTNLFQNFAHWTSNTSLTFSISSSLNNGSVCAFYLLFDIMLISRFRSFNILFHSKPQHAILNCRSDKDQRIIDEFDGWNG